MKKSEKEGVSKSQRDQYMINKYTGSGMPIKNISYEIEDGYEFKRVKLFGGSKEGITINKIK